MVRETMMGDNVLHVAARSANPGSVAEAISKVDNDGGEGELKRLLSEPNLAGEIPLHVAVESGSAEVVAEMLKHHDVDFAAARARHGYDPFHLAAKQGHLGILKVMMEAMPQLAMTVDRSNTTALHTAAARGHVAVVDFLSMRARHLLSISRSNCKTALHSAARNGHLAVVKALLAEDPEIALRLDRKKQTALHMAAKGHSVDLVVELVDSVPSLLNMVDSKGNTALHIASRKGRDQIVEKLLTNVDVHKYTVNKQGESALDTAERNAMTATSRILSSRGVQNAEPKSKDIKQTVKVIRHTVHDQIQHTRQTRRRVQGMAKRLEKMQLEGLNNAINSTTVVAVLIATVAFAAIFSVPGNYSDGNDLAPSATDLSIGEAVVGPRTEFIIFFVFDSFALFLSLAVVVVQTSVVVTERRAKKKLMAVINKLMWLACVMVSVAFLALSYIVVGDHGRVLAIGVTLIGTVIMATTLGTMCFLVVMNRLQSSGSVSPCLSNSMRSDSDVALNNDVYKTVFAV